MWSTATRDPNSRRGKKEQRNERWSSKRQVRIRSWKTLPSSPKPSMARSNMQGPGNAYPPGGNLTCFPFNRNKSLIVEGEVFIDSKFLVSNSMICWGENNQLLQDTGFRQYKCSQEALQSTDREEFTISMNSPT